MKTITLSIDAKKPYIEGQKGIDFNFKPLK